MSLPVLDILLYHTLLIVIAGAVGFAWGLSEIVDAFAFDTGHALRTGGAWLLLLTNAFAAAGTYVFIASIVPGLDTWYAALLTGLAWPVVIRNANIKLAARMTDAATSDDPPSAAIRFEQIYARFQNLARRWINAALAWQRVQLIIRATQCELADLASHARLLLVASPLQEGEEASAILDNIISGSDADDKKKALLAAFILTNFGREALDAFVRQKKRRAALPDTRG